MGGFGVGCVRLVFRFRGWWRRGVLWLRWLRGVVWGLGRVCIEYVYGRCGCGWCLFGLLLSFGVVWAG